MCANIAMPFSGGINTDDCNAARAPATTNQQPRSNLSLFTANHPNSQPASQPPVAAVAPDVDFETRLVLTFTGMKTNDA